MQGLSELNSRLERFLSTIIEPLSATESETSAYSAMSDSDLQKELTFCQDMIRNISKRSQDRPQNSSRREEDERDAAEEAPFRRKMNIIRDIMNSRVTPEQRAAKKAAEDKARMDRYRAASRAADERVNGSR